MKIEHLIPYCYKEVVRILVMQDHRGIQMYGCTSVGEMFEELCHKDVGCWIVKYKK